MVRLHVRPLWAIYPLNTVTVTLFSWTFYRPWLVGIKREYNHHVNSLFNENISLYLILGAAVVAKLAPDFVFLQKISFVPFILVHMSLYGITICL